MFLIYSLRRVSQRDSSGESRCNFRSMDPHGTPAEETDVSKPRDWKALTMITCQALRDVMGRSQTGQMGPIPTQGERQGSALEAALVVPPSVR